MRRLRSIGLLLSPVVLGLFALKIACGSQIWKKDSLQDESYAVVIPIRLHKSSDNRVKRNVVENSVSYSFSGFSRHFILDLEPVDNLLHPDFRVMTLWEGTQNSTLKVQLRPELRGCLYRGHVRDDIHSAVSLSNCRGLLGLIHTCAGDYRIEPDFSRNSSSLHRLYKMHNGSEDCRFRNFTNLVDNVQRDSYSTTSTAQRSRRSVSQEWDLEMLVVADSKMKRYHGDNLEMYILTLMASVALIFKDPSIGNNINVSVVKLIVMEEGQDTGIIFASASKTLRNFCRWQYQQNDKSNPLGTHDTAILLTREDLCRQSRTCDTLGLAQSGMVCDSYSSCAVIEDNGLSAAFTIAHELGHILGIPHDEDSKCSRFQEQNQRLHIMARMLDYNSHPWSWSECSRHYVTSFLDAGYGNCLLNRSPRNKLSRFAYASTPPGELYDMDYQCELVFGQGSKICPYMPVCKRLWCTMEDASQGGCRTQHMPWADGTKCAPDKSCRHGECVTDPITVGPPQDGHWGKWQDFGPCSRTCGGGVRTSIRECDSPKPLNGGRYCVGDRTRYQSCNTQDCLSGSIDFREEQCSYFDGKTFGFANVDENVRWVPHYEGIAAREVCKLYCRAAGTSAYYLLKEKVIDGTPCGPDTHDICVNGKCMPAGCDHILGSEEKPDSCGVCGGDGSTCKVIHGDYGKVKYGYNHVVMVPAGASNIEILQYGHENMKDDNYLALMDSNNTYILNGDFMISMFPKTLHYAGSILEYSGSDSVIEKINATKQLHKNLYVQVLTVGKLHPPSISFSYTISLKDQILYQWQIEQNWSPCNSLCQGEKFRKAVCISIVDERIVSDGHCREQERPAHSAKACNTNCTLRWHKIPVRPCSSACGEGFILNDVKCFQHVETGSVLEIPDQFCAHLEPRPEKHEPCMGTCNNTAWKYSEWSECTVTCGGGKQSRTAVCLGDGVVKLPDDACSNETKSVSQMCATDACPKWEMHDWQECSATCGKGKRSRSYQCKKDGKVIENEFCGNTSIPVHVEQCSLPPCYMWNAGPWDRCTVSCGTGVMKRPIHCQSTSGIAVNTQFCDAYKKPPESKKCEKPPCPKPFYYLPNIPYSDVENMVPPFISHLKDDFNLHVEPQWKVGEWSPCTTTCGEGTMRRLIVCHDPSTGRGLQERRCKKENKPVDIRVCHQQPCMKWVSGNWSPCSATCGEGKQVRHVICANHEGKSFDENSCDPEIQPLKEKPCIVRECASLFQDLFPDPTVLQNSVESIYIWRYGLWGKCSKPCGGGIKRRQVVCYDESGENSTYCDPKRKPTDQISCNVEKCPEWEKSIWSKCSTKCGIGVRTREVRCVNHKGYSVPSSRCLLPAPPEEKKCKSHCLHWSWTEWSECSSSCGNGTQTRVAYCQRGRRSVTDDHCDLKLKPQPQTRFCKGSSCNYHWRKKKWSLCSASCGKGHKVRAVYCVDGNNVTVPDVFCSERKKPQFEKSCQGHFCPFIWRAGHWSECSKSCGSGIQQRSVTCHKVNEYGYVYPETIPVLESGSLSEWCSTSSKPSAVRNCSLGSCDSFVWRPDTWLPCSVSCGDGRQKRRVRCYSPQGRRVAANRCQRNLRPQKRRKCHMRTCGSISCLDYQRRANVTADGEQQLLVHGKNITVYCADMNSPDPKEYVTLARGDRDNYSEIYNKRLITPDTCPYGGRRYEACECIPDENTSPRLTVFHRIAINISSLQVFTHDFRFSVTESGKPVPYGEAGDCYSVTYCPQGRFSVNLLGTGLKVSSATKWVKQGRNASSAINFWENHQVVQGMCGGYCGWCSPDPAVGLLLEVAPP